MRLFGKSERPVDRDITPQMINAGLMAYEAINPLEAQPKDIVAAIINAALKKKSEPADNDLELRNDVEEDDDDISKIIPSYDPYD